MKGEKPLVTEFLMLPNDLLLNCLARVSRLYYPTLALVSKEFRSLLALLEHCQIRTLLGYTESCLYVYLMLPDDSDDLYSWFTLCRRPIQITDPSPNPNPRCFNPWFARFIKSCTRKKEKKLSENYLVSVPSPSSPYVGRNDVAAVGYNIYKIGGIDDDGLPSSKVFFMDCRSNTWHEAPSMRKARALPCVSVLDGRIYVIGGNEDCDSSNWIEVFDPKTQVWEHVQSPDMVIRDTYLLKSLPIEGKLYLMIEFIILVYKPEENKWDDLGFMRSSVLYLNSSCVIDNVVYCYAWSGRLKWYDCEARFWRAVKGLGKMPKLPKGYGCHKLVAYHGKIAVLWETDMLTEKKIWYAEISLERHNEQEIRGKIEWCDDVLTVSKLCYLMHFLAVTL